MEADRLSRLCNLPMPSIRVFVNGRSAELEAGGTALDAVRSIDPPEAGAVTAGAREITDSRGLPIDASSPAFSGAIYRTVRSKPAADSA